MKRVNTRSESREGNYTVLHLTVTVTDSDDVFQLCFSEKDLTWLIEKVMMPEYRDRLPWRISEKKNNREFLSLLTQLLAEQPGGRELMLVMDNPGYHRANLVKEFLKKNQDRMHAFWLSPYSPELNLSERVWLYLTENVTNNYFFGELPGLIEATQQTCERLASRSDKLLQVNFKAGKNLLQSG